MKNEIEMRKEWKKEWDKMAKTNSDWPTWEVFKRMKQQEASRMAEVDRCEALTTQHLN
tara:strand:+ start:1310 stop:1483 length:174 start_codon:yes stop_codon:yes gene_type:complete